MCSAIEQFCLHLVCWRCSSGCEEWAFSPYRGGRLCLPVERKTAAIGVGEMVLSGPQMICEYGLDLQQYSALYLFQ